MKLTPKCPQCGLMMDITLHRESDPIFSEHYFGGVRDCPNCDLYIHITITGSRKETPEHDEYVFAGEV
jgi:hypothetical protein